MVFNANRSVGGSPFDDLLAPPGASSCGEEIEAAAAVSTPATAVFTRSA